MKANNCVCQNCNIRDSDSDMENLNKYPEFNSESGTDDVSQNSNCIVCLKTINNVIKIYHAKLVKGMYTRSVLN